MEPPSDEPKENPVVAEPIADKNDKPIPPQPDPKEKEEVNETFAPPNWVLLQNVIFLVVLLLMHLSNFYFSQTTNPSLSILEFQRDQYVSVHDYNDLKNQVSFLMKQIESNQIKIEPSKDCIQLTRQQYDQLSLNQNELIQRQNQSEATQYQLGNQQKDILSLISQLNSTNYQVPAGKTAVNSSGTNSAAYQIMVNKFQNLSDEVGRLSKKISDLRLYIDKFNLEAYTSATGLKMEKFESLRKKIQYLEELFDKLFTESQNQRPLISTLKTGQQKLIDRVEIQGTTLQKQEEMISSLFDDQIKTENKIKKETSQIQLEIQNLQNKIKQLSNAL